MKKILICGCGGIGSHLVPYLRYFTDRGQLNDMKLVLMDHDKVEEKNRKYSNFEKEDIGKNKAQVLGERYNFEFMVAKLINPVQLKEFDVVVLAVDNSQTRDLVYKSDKFWIDCRSKGMGYSVFYKSQKTKNNTLNLKRPAESCQYEERLRAGMVDCGNIISAMFGVAQVLNYFRGTLTVNEIIGVI